jgi:aminopeptidase N
VETAFRRYLSDAQRDAAAPQLERTLWQAMRDDVPASRRILLLRAYAALAWSPAGLADLQRLLERDISLPGVALGARDRFRLAARLAQRGAPAASPLLAALEKLETGDDARRYAFAARAAQPGARAKRAMYERWRSDPALPESWVEEALEPFNAPEHAADTAPLLAPALAALPELKRTRKIFFVERWLAAFLGGQADAAALEDVRRLLQGNLDDDLRLKVLQAADGLERAVRIRERYAAAR